MIYIDCKLLRSNMLVLLLICLFALVFSNYVLPQTFRMSAPRAFMEEFKLLHVSVINS